MFAPQNRIVIVDNNEDQLKRLSKPFHDSGIGCRALTYDAMYTAPLDGIRIAFFDINLGDIADPQENKSQIFATLADALRLYISRSNGPYVLIFWTSNSVLIEGFKEYVVNRYEDVPPPFFISYIDKDEFIQADNDIDKKLEELLGTPIIKLLYDFEKQAFEAAAKTINQVYEIVPKDDIWGNNKGFTENFDKIFSKIAESTLGFGHAKKNPTKAVYSALIPILSYHLKYNSKPQIWDQNLTSLKSAPNAKKLTYPVSFDHRILNNLFHTEIPSLESGKDIRGIMLKHLVESPAEYSHIGSEYFIKLEEKCKYLFDLFVQFNKEQTTDEERDRIRSQSNFLFLEISAACDYSQGKKRINKYILGLMTPSISEKKLTKSSEAVFTLPEIIYESKPHQIRLNFNYVYGLEPKDERLGNPFLIIKGPLLDQISTEYARHVSRIGITSF